MCAWITLDFMSFASMVIRSQNIKTFCTFIFHQDLKFVDFTKIQSNHKINGNVPHIILIQGENFALVCYTDTVVSIYNYGIAWKILHPQQHCILYRFISSALQITSKSATWSLLAIILKWQLLRQKNVYWNREHPSRLNTVEQKSCEWSNTVSNNQMNVSKTIAFQERWVVIN